ncbi:glycosyltransferase family 2 protein [Alteromonas macleodii]|uniref:glycosyltransferase family 2 protein n=1 Tax=Alteromonas macleodii TaxID=28108 RepID=UPI0020768940|nr:glycosyltransferase family A protein [Alteromonas macleodii]USI28206.1 glycosyltransferase family 2 protein [Alteromonas macleodii]
MQKYHQNSSFSTFTKRVLGIDSLDQNELDALSGRISLSSSVSKREKEICLNTSLFSDKSCVKSSLISMSEAIEPNSQTIGLLPKMLAEKVNKVNSLLIKLDSASSTEIVELLASLNKEMSVDYGIDALFAESFQSILVNKNIASVALPLQLELSMLVGKELLLTENITKILSVLLKDTSFIGNVANIRTLQKIFAFKTFYEKSQIHHSLILPDGITDSRQLAFVLAICISACTSAEEFQEAIPPLSEVQELLGEMPISFLVETLNRSPVKLSFLPETYIQEQLIEKLTLDDESNLALCFRALYFTSESNLLSRFETKDIVSAVINLNERSFNKLYRDVRRSRKIILSDSDLHVLLESHASGLSLGKWSYVFSLLNEKLSTKEKLAFLEKVLINLGISVVNSEESLTLISAIGLKKLASIIINERLSLNSVKPIMPESNDYVLSDIFKSVLDSSRGLSPAGMQDGKVSVVITTFNPDLILLEQSLISIINQTYSNVEILLVDDCSDSDTALAIKSLVSSLEFKNVTYLRNDENIGQYLSRNKAIALASGTFIAIQDDDDVSHPERIAKQLAAMQEESTLLSFTKHIRFSDSGNISIDDPRNYLTFGDGPASLLFHRAVINKVGEFRNFRSRGDIDFRERVQTILGDGVISYVKTPLYIMRSSLSTVSSLYEYRNGDLLEFFRNRIKALSQRKAKNYPL